VNLFNRSISVSITTEDKKTATINGIFLDTHHEICLTLAADLDTFKILTAGGELRRVPHEDCRHCERLIKNLAGLQIGPALNKQIKACVGSESGCAHLADLTMECVKSFIQGKGTMMLQNLCEEESDLFIGTFLKGTCYHYRTEK